jgi:hypothetical protein
MQQNEKLLNIELYNLQKIKDYKYINEYIKEIIYIEENDVIDFIKYDFNNDDKQKFLEIQTKFKEIDPNNNNLDKNIYNIYKYLINICEFKNENKISTNFINFINDMTTKQNYDDMKLYNLITCLVNKFKFISYEDNITYKQIDMSGFTYENNDVFKYCSKQYNNATIAQFNSDVENEITNALNLMKNDYGIATYMPDMKPKTIFTQTMMEILKIFYETQCIYNKNKIGYDIIQKTKKNYDNQMKNMDIMKNTLNDEINEKNNELNMINLKYDNARNEHDILIEKINKFKNNIDQLKKNSQQLNNMQNTYDTNNEEIVRLKTDLKNLKIIIDEYTKVSVNHTENSINTDDKIENLRTDIKNEMSSLIIEMSKK